MRATESNLSKPLNGFVLIQQEDHLPVAQNHLAVDETNKMEFLHSPKNL
jgi:hypothetical protein